MVLLGLLSVIGLGTAQASATSSAKLNWTKLSPATSPTARFGASMAYDPATGNMLLFGGDVGGANPYLADTWSWNGTTWTKLSPATSPTARYGASMAYDPATGNMVLFGGAGKDGYLADTWTWNGTTWTKLSPATSPTARYEASMAYDPATGKMVLFGGFFGSKTFFGETWTWNGTNWEKLAPAVPTGHDTHSPLWSLDGLRPGHGDHAPLRRRQQQGHRRLSRRHLDMERRDLDEALPGHQHYSPLRSLDGLRPGHGEHGALLRRRRCRLPLRHLDLEREHLDEARPGHTSPSRYEASMAFDPATGNMVLFGGAGTTFNFPDTWTWGFSPQPASTWTKLSPATSPTSRDGPSMAFDPATANLVLFGGSDGGYLGDTWTWNGTTWTKLSPPTSPTAREGATMAYDPATGNVVLFGGSNGGYLADTWTWNGTTWKRLSPSTSPTARDGAAMAYDPATGSMVLFGGFDGSNLADTWTWNGTTWTKVTPATSPTARDGATMAYDPATQNMVLFGGSDGSFLADTWTWSGTTWTKLSPAKSPTARDGASMAYDPATANVVLFGGSDGSFLADTWTWSGTTWTKLSPAKSPTARDGASMAYDPATANLVLFGGSDGGYLADTWTLVPAIPPSKPAKPFVIAGTGKVTVYWTAPTTGGSITGYTVTSTPTGKTCTTTGSELHSYRLEERDVLHLHGDGSQRGRYKHTVDTFDEGHAHGGPRHARTSPPPLLVIKRCRCPGQPQQQGA